MKISRPTKHKGFDDQPRHCALRVFIRELQPGKAFKVSNLPTAKATASAQRSALNFAKLEGVPITTRKGVGSVTIRRPLPNE